MSRSSSLRFLVLAGVAGTFAALAGCSSEGTDAAAPEDTGGSSSSSSSSGDPGESSSSSSSSSGEPEEDAGPVLLPSAVAAAVAVGRLHTCALTTTGAVRCWGYLEHGQVGNGASYTSDRQRVPAQVTGLESGITAIASGADHSCALTAAGGVKCWGANAFGQLGNDPQTTSTTTTDSAVPVDVAGLSSGVKAIAADAQHTCALLTAGTVKCWGYNDAGQLGNDSEEEWSGVPVDVVGLTGVTSIEAGYGTYGSGHTCAVSGGEVYCWGTNVFGQMGQDTDVINGSHVPVKIPNFTGVASVAAGFFETCAVMTAGGATCWGQNNVGQIGNGVLDTFADDVTVPATVMSLTGVTQITVGSSYACAVAGGAAKCWGENLVGALGNGEGPGFQTSVPVDVTGLGSGVAALSAQGDHACALTTAGALHCWGENNSGSLGNDTVGDTTSYVPVPVRSFP